MKQDVVFNKSNLHYHKADVVDLPVGEPLAENDVLEDLLPTSVGDNSIPPQPQSTRIIKLHLTDDNDDDTFRIALERADGSVDSDDEIGQDEDHSGNDDSNTDSQSSTPTPPPPAKRRRIFKSQEGERRQSSRLAVKEKIDYKAANKGPQLPPKLKRKEPAI